MLTRRLQDVSFMTESWYRTSQTVNDGDAFVLMPSSAEHHDCPDGFDRRHSPFCSFVLALGRGIATPFLYQAAQRSVFKVLACELARFEAMSIHAKPPPPRPPPTTTSTTTIIIIIIITTTTTTTTTTARLLLR